MEPPKAEQRVPESQDAQPDESDAPPLSDILRDAISNEGDDHATADPGPERQPDEPEEATPVSDIHTETLGTQTEAEEPASISNILHDGLSTSPPEPVERSLEPEPEQQQPDEVAPLSDAQIGSLEQPPLSDDTGGSPEDVAPVTDVLDDSLATSPAETDETPPGGDAPLPDIHPDAIAGSPPEPDDDAPLTDSLEDGVDVSPAEPVERAVEPEDAGPLSDDLSDNVAISPGEPEHPPQDEVAPLP